MKRLIACALLILTQLTYAATPPETSPQEYQAHPKSIELNERGAQFIKSGEFAKAEPLFKEALVHDPRNVTAAFNLASTYLASNRESEALKILQDYTAKYPNDAGLHARLGDAYFATKNVEAAKIAYEKTLSLAPNYTGVPEKLGTVYLLVKKPGDAEKMFSQAVQQTPKDAKLLTNLSNVQLINKKWDDAIATAKRSLQVKPSSEAYVALGMAYEMQKDLKSALIAFERAVDLGEKRPEIQEKIKQLKTVTARG